MSKQYLQQIQSMVAALREKLPPQSSVVATNLEEIRSIIPSPELRQLNPTGLASALSEFGLSVQSIESLVQLFVVIQQNLATSFQKQYESAATALRDTEGSRQHHLDRLSIMTSARFLRCSHELEHVIIDLVKSRTKAASNEQELGRLHHCESSTSITAVRRGHDTDAVRILEQAFNHSPNITQAEKFQLAEVTGLKPKQVTIWFQNRRNRKGKRMSQPDPTKLPPNQPSPPEHDFTPSSPPTRDFTLSEKKRKSYGALGRALPEYTESDTDSPLSFIKKPRLPRSSSGVSDASISSVEYDAPFTIWSSPSSRSTSSSSASSSPSNCFDSPSKSANVFKYINPLKYEVRAKAEMPTVTIGTAPLESYQGMTQAEVSPFNSDQNANTSDRRQSLQLKGGTGLAFNGLQLNMEALDRELRESIQKALELSASGQLGGGNVSLSSCGSQQETTDDDGWVDEDDFGTASAGRQDTPATGAVVEQGAPMPPVSQHMSSGLPSQAVYQAPVQSTQYLNTQSTLRPQPSTGSDNSLDSAFSYTAVENESFDLNQFFESAALSATLPSSSPFVPHQHHSSPAPTATPGIDANTSCFDLEVDMTDIQDYLDSEILANSLPVPQPTDSTDGMLEGCVGTAGQFYLNFDLSSNMFSLV
uniref:B mating type protein n=1 Tax=Ustilago esculenta TaxID=185366 RepID=A0A481SFJ8_9BASI|nr:B mating type protein [Ustilago esculenta]